ncbi:helix-turn-helix domain-containing protein [Streptomyces cellulosae]|uniref:helix-turn-helix domain-containing protein n=1 Tax=Streptomyces sp. SID8376 TaxID=2690356 RepID=UPI00406CE38F
MHPNTVSRRLEGITELSGADRQHPERALAIQLALRLYRTRRTLRGRQVSRRPSPRGHRRSRPRVSATGEIRRRNREPVEHGAVPLRMGRGNRMPVPRDRSVGVLPWHATHADAPNSARRSPLSP